MVSITATAAVRMFGCIFYCCTKMGYIQWIHLCHRFDVKIPRGKFNDFHGNYIHFERRIYMEIMTSARRGYFNVDSTFKIDEMSMSSLREIIVVPTSNRSNFCTRFPFYHFLTLYALGTYSKLFWYNAESL